MVRYFYANQRFVTQIDDLRAASVFHAAATVLGEVDGQYPAMLAVNLHNSVLKARRNRNYSAYGFEMLMPVVSLLGFNGERRDAVSGCDLLGNGVRAYNPVLMRFCSPDSLSPFGAGGVNAFAYCEGDPVNFVDPNGRGKTSPRPSASYLKLFEGVSGRSRTINRQHFGPAEIRGRANFSRMLDGTLNLMNTASRHAAPIADGGFDSANAHSAGQNNFEVYLEKRIQEVSSKVQAAALERWHRYLLGVNDAQDIALTHEERYSVIKIDTLNSELGEVGVTLKGLAQIIYPSANKLFIEDKWLRYSGFASRVVAFERDTIRS